MDALTIGAALLPRLVSFIEEEIADGKKSADEATRAALLRLANEKTLSPILPTVQTDIAHARLPASERDAETK